MILTVCLNPALDITYTVAELLPGASHRVQAVRRRAGGKGINVAAVLHQQGVEAVAIAPVGGSTGADLRDGLDRAGIPHVLTPIDASTRQTVTVVANDTATVLNEAGPTLSSAEWQAFTAKFSAVAHDAAVVTISGSLPGGVGSDAYAQLVRLAHAADTTVILDCEGESLVEALHAGPDVVKINEHEAAATTGIETSSADSVFAAAEELHALGAAEVVVTRGAAGIAARVSNGRYVGQPAKTVTGNPTGAGDAFTAGLAASVAAGLDWPARLRRASGWAAGAVARPVAGEVDRSIASDHETSTVIRELK